MTEMKQLAKRVKELENENAKLKIECRTCVFTDSPCVLSDYPSKNGMCSHYKNVFEENAELKMKIYGGGYEMIITKKDADIILLEKQLKEQKEHHKSVCENLTNTHRNIRDQLIKAKEIIKALLKTPRTVYRRDEDGEVVPYESMAYARLKEEAEQFLKEIEK